MPYFLSPAKINLYLKILGKRQDGYHLLESVFSFINLFDVIQIDLIPENKIIFASKIPEIQLQNNLILIAANLFKKITQYPYGAVISLKKNIPLGAGLGGGSSNAATILIALNHLWKIQLTTTELKNLGIQIGADVPFFIFGENALVTGIGELLKPIQLKQSYYLIVFPNISVSTKKVFTHLTLTQSKRTSIISGLDNSEVTNDLQETAFLLYPELQKVSDMLKPYGKPIMTGSGSCILIETRTKEDAIKIQKKLPNQYRMFCVETLPQHPLNGLKKKDGESSSG